MAYIGLSPVVGEFRKLDDISGQFNDSNTVFNLTVAGSAVSAGSAQNLIISVDGIVQEPQASFTVGGSTLSFTEAPNTASTFFGILLGSVAQVGVPSDDTVSSVKLQANSVTTAKIAANTSIQFAAGSNTAPSISTVSDTNTGIFFPAADTIAFAEGGVEAMRIDSAGNVGIGVGSPGAKLDVNGAVVALGGNAPTGGFQLRNVGGTITPRITNDNSDGTVIRPGASSASVKFNNFANTVELAQITNDGFLRLASGGIQFNGDTAAANALDDYEEGTWTPDITASTTNPSVTYGSNGQTGFYTKIGRQVFVQAFIRLTARTGGSGGAQISGLPFTPANVTENFSVGTVGQMENFTSSLGDTDGQIIVVRSNQNSTNLTWYESNETSGIDWPIGNIGASFLMRLSITYFV